MATYDSFWRLTNATGIAGGFDIASNLGVAHPKLKFNFTVQFVPRYLMTEVGNTEMDKMVFALKTATRPKPSINYDDVNFYNFRTKVAKNMDYGEVSLSFYDDPDNYAHDIVTQYLATVSPVFGRRQEEANDLDSAGQSNSASIGPLRGNRHGPMKSIIVKQWYAGQAAIPRFVEYEYLNPKLINAELDDLDMSVSEFSLVNISFTYDTFNVKKG